MTALDAANDLFDYFETKSSFSFQDDYKELVKIEGTDKDETLRKAAYKAGLSLLEKDGFIIQTSGKYPCWILAKPFSLYSQSVEMSGRASSYISQIINKLYEIAGSELKCDSRNISESDFIFPANACLKITETAMSNNNEKDEE